MKVIKLDAIDSTNDFLKGLINDQVVENLTVITAENQTKGRGQMGSKWVSEVSKNLIMSVLIKDSISHINHIYNLNIVVSIAIINALEKYKIPKLSIKWPNDILSDNKKIGGILIENIIKSNQEIISIVGIGLNVNQTNFENLPKASSMSVIMSKNFDRDLILESIFLMLESSIEKIKADDLSSSWELYNSYLFKKGKPTLFENSNHEQFMGIINSVDPDGKLNVILEDDSIKTFGIKEITMHY
jgi:BirA family transcriptional regulator, biotin operon repressor / biotin---[acetyl-CoA-carboxylase] ligase